MSEEVYEDGSTNFRLVNVSAIYDEDGSIKFINDSLSSSNFDGYIFSTNASVGVTQITAGQSIGIQSSTSSVLNFYPIIKVEAEDPVLTSPYTGAHYIYYLDNNETFTSSYSSSAASVIIRYDDWEGKNLGTAGWTITSGGNAIFSNIAARGRIEATSGYIGDAYSGWEIGANLLSNASVGFYAPSAFSSAEIAIFSGSPFTGRATAPFRVNYGGLMNATGASISGALTATTLNVGGSAGITYDGSIVTIGSSVVINSTLTTNSLQVGASPALLRIANDVEGTNDGIYIDPYNFWYSDGKFSVGGSANSACWNGNALSVKGNIIATSGSFSGDITASAGRFVGALSVSSSGAIYAGTNVDSGQRTVLNASGLFGYHSSGIEAFALPVSGSPRIGTFTIIPTGIVSQSASNANMIYGNVDASGSVTDGIVIRGSRSLNASAAIYTVQNGVETSYASGNGFYVDENARFKLKGATGSLSFDGTDLYVSGNINATSGQFTGSVTAQNITASIGNIAGFTLAKNQLSATNIILSSSGGFRLGNNNQFSVTTNGFLSASSASIVGDSVINGTNIGNGGGNISSNLRVGEGALSNNTTGDRNIALGDYSLYSNMSGQRNIAVGASVLFSNTNSYNIGIGFRVLSKTTTGGSNLAIGESSLLENRTGGQNIAIGNSSLARALYSNSNIAIGSQALLALGQSTSSAVPNPNNIAIGNNAGLFLESGSGNVFIGSYRGPGVPHNDRVYISDGSQNQKLTIDENAEATFYGNVIIPSGKNLTVDTNTLFVDGTNNRVGIGTISPASAFHVTGSALFDSNVLVSGQLSANNVNISGSITSASLTSTFGTIAGWTLSASALTAGTGASTVGFVSAPQSNNIILYAGNSTPSSAPFKVTYGGNLIAPSVTVNGNLTASTVETTSNGVGQNFKVGDDVWIGDINNANVMSIRGVQNSNVGYILFGNSTASLGYNGTALVYGGPVSLTGTSITLGTSSAATEVRSQAIFDTLTANAATVQIAGAANNYRLQRSTASSRKWKHDIKDMPSILQDVLNLRPVTFKYNLDYLPSTDNRSGLDVYGLIAEEVADVIPLAADYDEGQPSDWNYRILVPILIKAIQEQQKQIEELSDRINSLGDNDG